MSHSLSLLDGLRLPALCHGNITYRILYRGWLSVPFSLKRKNAFVSWDGFQALYKMEHFRHIIYQNDMKRGIVNMCPSVRGS